MERVNVADLVLDVQRKWRRVYALFDSDRCGCTVPQVPIYLHGEYAGSVYPPMGHREHRSSDWVFMTSPFSLAGSTSIRPWLTLDGAVSMLVQLYYLAHDAETA